MLAGKIYEVNFLLKDVFNPHFEIFKYPPHFYSSSV